MFGMLGLVLVLEIELVVVLCFFLVGSLMVFLGFVFGLFLGSRRLLRFAIEILCLVGSMVCWVYGVLLRVRYWIIESFGLC